MMNTSTRVLVRRLDLLAPQNSRELKSMPNSLHDLKISNKEGAMNEDVECVVNVGKS